MPSSSKRTTPQEALFQHYHVTVSGHLAYIIPRYGMIEQLTPCTLAPRIRGLMRHILDLPLDCRIETQPTLDHLLRAQWTLPQALASLTDIMFKLAQTLDDLGRDIEAHEARKQAAQLKWWTGREEQSEEQGKLDGVLCRDIGGVKLE